MMSRAVRRTLLNFEHLETRETPALFATVTPPGAAAQVLIKDTSTWATLYTVNPFNGYTGGIQAAIADVNGDGTEDCIIAAKGPNGSTSLAMYNGTSGTLIRSLAVGDASSRIGLSVTTAGQNATGQDLLAVGALSGGSSTVFIVNAETGAIVNKVVPFGSYSGPLTIASADVSGDTVADIIVGGGPGAGPRLAVIDGATGTRLFDKFMFEDFFTGGVNLGLGDLNADSKPEILVSAGVKGGPRVRVLNPVTWTTTHDFFAYDSNQRDGVQATVFSPSQGAAAAIITVDGPGQSGPVKAFHGTTGVEISAPTVAAYPIAAPPVITGPTTYIGGPSLTTDAGMTNTLPDVNDPSWVSLGNGLKSLDIQTGSAGAAVVSTSQLSVFYSGWLLNGSKFDSARSPSSPASFALSGLIQGWKTGLLGMKAGGIRRLYIPSALGYGASGSGSSIPPNSDLVFEIKLVSVT